jgi:hypothetical protein
VVAAADAAGAVATSVGAGAGLVVGGWSAAVVVTAAAATVLLAAATLPGEAVFPPEPHAAVITSNEPRSPAVISRDF